VNQIEDERLDEVVATGSRTSGDGEVIQRHGGLGSTTSVRRRPEFDQS
jgi:hypothetical protein